MSQQPPHPHLDTAGHGAGGPDAADAFGNMRRAVARHLELPSTLDNAIFLAERLAAATSQSADFELLATCYAKRGRYAPAVAALERVPDRSPDARYLLAWSQLRLGNTRDALASLTRGVDVEAEFRDTRQTSVPRQGAGVLLAGQICEASGAPDEALRYYKLALELDPYLFDARERIAKLKASRKAPAEAPRRPGLAAGSDPGLAMLLAMEEAVGLLARYRCDEALKVLNGLPMEQLHTGFVLHQIGRAHFEKGEFTEACAAFEAMRAVDPFRVQGLELYSTALWHLKRSKDLAHLAQDASLQNPRAPETLCVLGNSFSLEKEHDTAIKSFRDAIEADPEFTYAYTLAAAEYVANEDFDKARTFYRTALRKDPNHYNAWWGLGTIYFRQEKNEMAEQHFRRALDIHPSSSVLWCFLGIVLHAQHREHDALKALDKAGALSPGNPQVKFQRAHVLQALGRLEEALRELEAVRDAAPKEASVHLMMGNICKTLGFRDRAYRDRAMHHFVTALDLEPKDAATVRAAIDQLDDGGAAGEDETQRIVGDVDAMLT